MDGFRDAAIENLINEILTNVSANNHVIKNKNCEGLAFSLNRGLKYCSNDWVARMDADDIAMPERFSKQIGYIANNLFIAVLGSSVQEFGNVAKERTKQAITDSNAIKNTLKYRNPMNHPSCILNKEKVLSVGGYPSFEKNQDYGLWILLVSKGYKLENLKDVLLKFRISKNFYTKRGISLLKNDFSVLLLQKKLGLISSFMFIVLLILRMIFRFLPLTLLRLSYTLSRK
jgi:amylovoran biosynthesis glycosyltransferase AmsE